jgi:predicted site-specific integrase-resolvase
MEGTMREFLEANAVAKALNRAGSTIRVWVATGRLHPAARTKRGVWLFAPEEIERLAEQERAQARLAKQRREHETNL